MSGCSVELHGAEERHATDKKNGICQEAQGGSAGFFPLKGLKTILSAKMVNLHISKVRRNAIC